MGLEVQARIQHRLAQHSVGHQLQHDQEPPDAPITVEEGMNRLELDMRQRRLDERRRRLGLIVEEALELLKAIRHRLGRRRHEDRIARPRAGAFACAEPIIRMNVILVYVANVNQRRGLVQVIEYDCVWTVVACSAI
jgi:hypothetical protein